LPDIVGQISLRQCSSSQHVQSPHELRKKSQKFLNWAHRSTPCAITEATDVKTADPACSTRFGTPSFVCFDCTQPSIFESAFLHSTLSGARTRILPSRLPASMMAFSPLLTSPPFFLPLLSAGARVLSLRSRVRLNRLLLHPFLARHTQPLGRIPFPFLPSPLPSFLHPLRNVTCPRVSSYSSPPPPIPACASCVTSLSSVSPSSSRTMFCAMSFLN